MRTTARLSATSAEGARNERANMQRAFFQHLDKMFNELERFWNPPPPPPEPEMVYVEAEEGSNRLGYRDFNARLFAAPLRWR